MVNTRRKLSPLSAALLGLTLLGGFLYTGCANKDERKSLLITASNVERIHGVLSDSSNFSSRDWVHVNAFNERFGCTVSETLEGISTDLWDMLRIELDSTFLIGKTINEIIDFEKEVEQERVLLGGPSSIEIMRKSREIYSVYRSHQSRVDSLTSLISVEMIDARVGRDFGDRMGEVVIRLRVSNNGDRDIRNYSLHASLEHPSFGGDHETEYMVIFDEPSVPANSHIVIDGSVMFTGVLSMDKVEDFMKRPLDQYVFDSYVSEIEFADGELIEKYEDPTSKLRDELCRMVR